MTDWTKVKKINGTWGDFEKYNFIVVHKLLPTEEADRLHKYLLLKREAVKFMKENGRLNAWDSLLGTWSDEQIPGTFSCYSDFLMETYLQELKPKFEKHMNMELYENYSYCRVYKNGDILHRHKDRYSCEMSSTIFLGGDSWNICLEPDETQGQHDKETGQYIPSQSNGIHITLEPGDALIYKGCIVEHWREAFQGEVCSQVFMHYTDASKEEALENKFDSRPLLGIPKHVQ